MMVVVVEFRDARAATEQSERCLVFSAEVIPYSVWPGNVPASSWRNLCQWMKVCFNESAATLTQEGNAAGSQAALYAETKIYPTAKKKTKFVHPSGALLLQPLVFFGDDSKSGKRTRVQ